jgi:hypothetical protein
MSRFAPNVHVHQASLLLVPPVEKWKFRQIYGIDSCSPLCSSLKAIDVSEEHIAAISRDEE